MYKILVHISGLTSRCDRCLQILPTYVRTYNNTVSLIVQIITNGKFKSVEHRVLMPQTLEPRTSIACFVGTDDLQKPYGPINELISESNPPIYKEVLFGEYMNKYKL